MTAEEKLANARLKDIESVLQRKMKKPHQQSLKYMFCLYCLEKMSGIGSEKMRGNTSVEEFAAIASPIGMEARYGDIQSLNCTHSEIPTAEYVLSLLGPTTR